MGEAREDIGSMLYDKFSSFIARYWYLTISKTELWIILLHNHMKYFYYESWEKTSSYSKHNIPSKNSGCPKNPPYPLPFNFEYFDPKNEPNGSCITILPDWKWWNFDFLGHTLVYSRWIQVLDSLVNFVVCISICYPDLLWFWVLLDMQNIYIGWLRVGEWE